MHATCLKRKICTAYVLHCLLDIHVYSFLSFTVLLLTARGGVFIFVFRFLQDHRARIRQSLKPLAKRREICFLVVCALFFILIELQVFWMGFCIALLLRWIFTTAQSLNVTVFLMSFFFFFFLLI